MLLNYGYWLSLRNGSNSEASVYATADNFSAGFQCYPKLKAHYAEYNSSWAAQTIDEHETEEEEQRGEKVVHRCQRRYD